MVTIDLDIDRQFDELFRKVEAGKVLRIMRGEREVAIVMPSAHELNHAELAELEAWEKAGLKAWAEISPVDEFADWKKPDGTR